MTTKTLKQLYTNAKTTYDALVSALPKQQVDVLYHLINGMSACEVLKISSTNRDDIDVLCQEVLVSQTRPHAAVPLEERVPKTHQTDPLLVYDTSLRRMIDAMAYLKPFVDPDFDLEDGSQFVVDRLFFSSIAYSDVIYNEYNDWPFDERYPFVKEPEQSKGPVN
ncbi:hypothetical protein CJF42_25195 [Pseudoalteromonas sp. NBT06-2]|uniref:hypothetical protein n=1 Tax=Pseudoalteromonas sp. NBT06-2 TaxID=2025950 RepID=UPI000BA5CF7D|nr:hypothetical protein [Pseudoalteromonas sp. NBT06-2]PAJ71722.1 hypothetical protein CJF42_25195 [Pseudoalteromonas sp. NBT06-2]